MNEWISAHEAMRTDWTEERPQDRRTPRPEVAASIPCGLLRGDGQPCTERLFTEDGRELHLAEDHACGPRHRRYDPLFPPMAEAVDDERYEWRPNLHTGVMQKVRVR